jgi:predicted metalloprotease
VVRPPAGFPVAATARPAQYNAYQPQAARPGWQSYPYQAVQPGTWPAPTTQPAWPAPTTQPTWPPIAAPTTPTTTAWPPPTGVPANRVTQNWTAPTPGDATVWTLPTTTTAWPPPTGAPAYPAYPGQWAPPQKPRRTGRNAVIIALIVLLIVGPTMIGSIANLLEASGPTIPVGDRPTWAPTLATTDAPATEAPATEQPGGGATEAAPPAGGGEGPRFDQWPVDPNPAAPPQPQTYADLDLYLLDNPLYDQTLASVPCVVGSVDLVTGSTSEISAYLTSVVACLMDAWDDAVYAAGYELPRPSITVYNNPNFMTRCGEAPLENAFYCAADQQLYYSADLVNLLPELSDKRYVAEAIIAHEFGHAVQARSGITGSDDYYYSSAATEDEANEWSRRQEQQADCFAGLFLRAIADSAGLTNDDRSTAEAVFYALGDPPGGDHGLPANRATWFDTGVANTVVGACNTFAASADAVA